MISDRTIFVLIVVAFVVGWVTSFLSENVSRKGLGRFLLIVSVVFYLVGLALACVVAGVLPGGQVL